MWEQFFTYLAMTGIWFAFLVTVAGVTVIAFDHLSRWYEGRPNR